MPTRDDLFELFFMGPGLICLALIPLAALYTIVRRVRESRGRKRIEQAARAGRFAEARAMQQRVVSRLRKQSGRAATADLVHGLAREAHLALLAGDVEGAEKVGREAVALCEKTKRPAPALIAFAYLELGRVLGRIGKHKDGIDHLRQALAFSRQEPHLRSLACSNASLVARRLGWTEEALRLATEAVRAERAITKRPKPFLIASLGWANVALALAQTDIGQDGRTAADDALRVFRDLETQDPDFGEGLAMALYANAYARRATGDGRAFANEAHQRFRHLYERTPMLYERHLAEAERLLR